MRFAAVSMDVILLLLIFSFLILAHSSSSPLPTPPLDAAAAAVISDVLGARSTASFGIRVGERRFAARALSKDAARDLATT